MSLDLSLSVYEHAAALIKKSPWEVSRDGSLIFEAHRQAYELYQHKPVVVGIDIYNLEAEAYGCTINPCEGNSIPSIEEPLVGSVEEGLALPAYDPEKSGRIPLVIEAAGKLQGALPDADIRIPVSGPFSIAQNLLGFDQLLPACLLEPEKLSKLLNQLAEVQCRLVETIHQAGLGIAFFESAAAPPLLSPEQFATIELPALKTVIQKTAEITGNPVPCIIGGNTAPIIPQMLETGTNFLICPAETNREAFLAGMKDHPEVKIRINLDPSVYTRGSEADIKREIDSIWQLAKNQQNILLGTGAIPYETPTETILFIKEYAKNIGS